MRVLQVHNRYREPGGEDAVVAAEAGLLRAAGHDVVQYQVENPQSGFRAAGGLALAVWNPAAARRVQHLVDETRPDVAHVHNTWFSLSPTVAKALHDASVPVVMTLHNYRLMCVNAQLFRDGEPCEDCVGKFPWRGVAHQCYRDSVLASAASAAAIGAHRMLKTWERGVDRFLVLTEFARERFIASGLPEAKLWVKPNFAPDPGERVVAPSRSNRVLFAGRLSPEKGVGVLLEAWRLAASHSLELLVVGDGPLRSVLEAQASPGVRFAGRLPAEEVRSLMLSSRALALPSAVFEGQPMVELEALAAGLPVVVSDHGGVAETVDTSEAGIKATPGDVASWAEALHQLEDGTRIDEAGHAARIIYQDRYHPTVALHNLHQAYGRFAH